MMAFIERICDVLSGAELNEAFMRASKAADDLQEEARRRRNDPVKELVATQGGAVNDDK